MDERTLVAKIKGDEKEAFVFITVTSAFKIARMPAARGEYSVGACASTPWSCSCRFRSQMETVGERSH
jgi:hypothetical protein